MQAMLHRLSEEAELPLSERLLRSWNGYREPSSVYHHLEDLLGREPGIFLERYGSWLLADEVDLFRPLAEGCFEVHHYVRQLQPGTGTSGARTSHEATQSCATTKNRRLAMMRRLEEQGSFFTMQQMKERAPELYATYIGTDAGPWHQHQPPNSRATQGQPTLVRALLHELDKQTEKRVKQVAEVESSDRSELYTVDESDADVADVTGDAESVATFEQLMRERFLCGAESAFIDYCEVDQNSALDEVWARQETLDAQERYFDQD